MPSDPTRHRLDHIEQLLDGRLVPDQQSLLESHLEVCAECRRRLETAAADETYWIEAAKHLRDDVLDTEPAMNRKDRTHPWESVQIGPSDRSADGGGRSSQSDGPTSSESADALRIADYFDPTDDPRMLGRFDGYEIVGVIGCGGMGVVLKGFEPALDRYVAIKLLAPHLATSGAARARFAREARAAAAVLHENVVAIHRVSEAKGLPYLVVPYMPGESLQKRLDQEGPMQLREILRIGMQIAAGLAAAHAQGLIHRDIKPGNILLDKGVERVTITDFGLARAVDDASVTRSGVIAGTPQYMSPEQARGQPLDPRSDLFSLGSVLYALCVGRPPFRAETAFGVVHRIVECRPAAIRRDVPETPDWLCEIIAKLHAKNPGDRFQSAGEVALLLGRWLAHVEQPAIVPAPPRPADRLRRVQRLRRTAIVVALAVAVIGIAALCELPSLFGNRAANDAEQQAADPPGADVRSDPPGAALAPGLGRPADDNSVAALADERVFEAERWAVQERISRLEHQWSPEASAEGGDAHWKSRIQELHRRLDDLGQRTDHNMP